MTAHLTLVSPVLAKIEAAGGLVVLGVDPGPSSGMFLAGWAPGERKASLMARAFQCDAKGAPGMLSMLLAAHGELIACAGLEEFRSGPRSRKLKGTRADITRGGVTALSSLLEAAGIPVSVRPAATVMPWAGDERLSRAGLLDVTAGQAHARAAARHALYAAVHDAGLPDPRSTRAWKD